MALKPGTRFVYAGAAPILLAGIIRQAYGAHIDAFALEYLFKPLGIDETAVKWVKHSKQGLPHTGGGLSLRARDIAKIGQLVLADGKWKGKQIVSPQWIKDSTDYHLNSGLSGVVYGYLWWLRNVYIDGKKIPFYHANGYGGQHIMIFHTLHMVLVFTNGNYGKQDHSFQRLHKYILPAVL